MPAPFPEADSTPPVPPAADGVAVAWAIEAATVKQGETVAAASARRIGWQTDSFTASTAAPTDVEVVSPIERTPQVVEVLPARQAEWTDTRRWYRVALVQTTGVGFEVAQLPLVWTIRVVSLDGTWLVDGIDSDPGLDGGD